MSSELVINTDLNGDEINCLYNSLFAYNRAITKRNDYVAVTLCLRDEAKSILGGLLGETYWDWLHIQVLWVREDLRGRGWGNHLLAAAEAEAVERGCHNAYLETFSFQALEFYRKNGYVVFGQLENFPPAEIRYFIRKKLAGNPL
jgi:ribosomal protein S18 acetylase RimI-like enzyme